MDSDSDEENEMREIIQLTAVLEADEPQTSASSQYGSISSMISSASAINQKYARIDHALAINKMYEEKLRRLESVLIGRLRECREKLKIVQRLEPTNDRQESFRYVQCGRPYFKDKNFFPAPENEDTIFMKKNNMYNFASISLIPGWTVRDKSSLLSLILKLSQDIKKKELEAKIAHLKREAKNNNMTRSKLDKEVASINRQITGLRKLPLKDIALPLDQEYDWDLICTKLSQRHTPLEYRSLWKLFLHPTINKSSWSKDEHLSLQKISHEHGLQDWDQIAKELNTGRTGYQCFVYFRTNVTNTFTGHKWTKEEEEYLKRLVEYYREDNYIPWNKIAATMENRTKIQIYNKYWRLCCKRKGKFVAEEDAVILHCLEKFGPDYKKMAKYLPGRTPIQLRCRTRILKESRLSTVWTLEEDKQLLQLVANMDSTTNYASMTSYFPGKDRVHLRARYMILENWIKRNPNKDLKYAPRRGARRLGHGTVAENLNGAVEQLKTRIQCEVHNKKKKKLTSESPEVVIEDAIVALLVNEYVNNPEKVDQVVDEEDNSPKTKSHNLNVMNIRKLLILLKARLERNKFVSSIYSEKYPRLKDSDDLVYPIKVKSYSKTGSTKIMTLQNSPNIWGQNSLQDLRYVLPPNYATITGLKKIMSYVGSCPKPSASLNFNIKILTKKNTLFKQYLFELLERFHTLFLWPMLLSNQGPSINQSTPSTSIQPLGPEISGIIVSLDDENSAEIMDNAIDLIQTTS